VIQSREAVFVRLFALLALGTGCYGSSTGVVGGIESPTAHVRSSASTQNIKRVVVMPTRVVNEKSSFWLFQGSEVASINQGSFDAVVLRLRMALEFWGLTAIDARALQIDLGERTLVITRQDQNERPRSERRPSAATDHAERTLSVQHADFLSASTEARQKALRELEVDARCDIELRMSPMHGMDQRRMLSLRISVRGTHQEEELVRSTCEIDTLPGADTIAIATERVATCAIDGLRIAREAEVPE
jgi:hypothetical protein